MNYVTILQLVLKHLENIMTFNHLLSSILKQISIYFSQADKICVLGVMTQTYWFSATVSAAVDFFFDFMQYTFWTNTCYTYFSIMISSLNKVMPDWEHRKKWIEWLKNAILKISEKLVNKGKDLSCLFVLAVPRSLWVLSSPTRALGSESMES